MTFYIGSEHELPVVPFNEKAPSFHTVQLTENEMKVSEIIDLPYTLYFGSHIGCGCEFRYAVSDVASWIAVLSEDSASDEKQINHQHLYDYLKSNTNIESNLKIYGCWAEDFEAPKKMEEIFFEDLIHPQFFFNENCLYSLRTH